MKCISILIPTYNDACAALVEELHRQAEALDVDYEIIVADDGSTDPHTIECNRAINDLPRCRYVERRQNAGRAAIRNFLAAQARYDWLLFIDSDMVMCRQDYLRRYALTDDAAPVVDGGVTIGGSAAQWAGNLRFRYERSVAHEHTAARRQLSPYRDFHTANFLVRRDVMLRAPFDERFRHYGYEDVLFGKQLEQLSIPILHIDNPMSFEVFEPNADFIRKTEVGLNTLYQFRSELQGYSRLLTLVQRIPHAPVRLWHRLFGPLERRNLTGRRPSLLAFKLYRLGYLVTLCGRQP